MKTEKKEAEEGRQNMKFSHNHYITTQRKSTTVEGHTKKVTCTFFEHWNSRDKYKVSRIREFLYPGHHINGYCEALLSKNIGYFVSKTCTKVPYESKTLLNFESRYLEYTFHVKFQITLINQLKKWIDFHDKAKHIGFDGGRGVGRGGRGSELKLCGLGSTRS